MLRIAILTAVRLEAQIIARVLNLQPHSKDHWSFGDVSLFVVGIGAVHLSTVPIPQHGVIMAGVAGGLDPNLAIGDVIVDDASAGIPLRNNSGDTPLPRRGKIHTAASVIATPQDKAALFAQTGALAVEMENAPIRAWAAVNRIAFAGVRGISDTAEHTIDPAVLGLVDERGGLKKAALAKLLLTRPAMIGPLKQLGDNTHQAANAAAEVVKCLLADGWPGTT